MRQVRSYVQGYTFKPVNDDARTLCQLEDQNETLLRQIEEMQREIRALERGLAYNETEFNVLTSTRFVVAGLTETFWDHMADVDYNGGFYESLDEAHNIGKTEYKGSYIIFDLTGKQLFSTGDSK